jgi:hypothetical protein
MAFHGGDIRLEPTVVHMDDLLDEIGSGRLRVPAFQRPFVWRPDQMIDLFESIESGYPIGSLLLWQTHEDFPTLDKIGDIALPPRPTGDPVSYVLDGHQRLSTLFGTLRRPGPTAHPYDQRDWKWWIYRDLRKSAREPDRFRHHSSTLPTAQFLPLRSVSRTLDFLQFARSLESQIRDPARVAVMVREAEAVAQRIKGYKLTLIRLQGANLNEAVEVYTRLNRMGTRMDADQMVSALTYRRPGRPPLASRIDDIVTTIAETGFGDIPRLAVFRAVLAVSDEADIMSPHWEAVAGRLQDKLHDAVPATERAVASAVAFLRQDVSLPLAKLLPYAHQLVLLAAFFHHCPHPTDEQREELRRWFWVTSWASSFAGANSTMLRRAMREMTDFALNSGDLGLDLANAQPMPDQFNLNSARTRAYVIWELRELPKRLDTLRQPVDVVKLLASADSPVYRPVVVGDRRPANRIVLPLRPNLTVKKALEDFAPPDKDILDSHGIPIKAWHRLKEGKGQLFVDDRADHLTQRLADFAAELGVPLGPDLVGIADDDTE